MIPVTKTYLPPIEEYSAYLERIWESGWVTTNGQLAQELTTRLRDYLEAPEVLFVSSGTTALQIAIETLGIKGEIITTAFSYVATVNSIAWMGRTPILADIDPETLTLSPKMVEAAITPNTEAILATHVYGIPCDIDGLKDVAQRHGLRLIFDAAHSFGCRFRGIPLSHYGDASALSFHATKIFHTAEGGAVVLHASDQLERAIRAHNQGHLGKDRGYELIGINGKNSEFHAAMGLCILDKVPDLIAKRKEVCEAYDLRLLPSGVVTRPKIPDGTDYNYPYYPVLFKDEKALKLVFSTLISNGVMPRRYFHPALTSLDYVDQFECPVAESVSKRILCLPLSHDLNQSQITHICNIILQTLKT